MSLKDLYGVGLGLRREMLDELLPNLPSEVDFWEVAPENWIPLGGIYQQKLTEISQQSRLVNHGLSLSIGSTDPLDFTLLKDIKTFLDEHNVLIYSEHLSYCSNNGHLYDLLPISFTHEGIEHVAERIKIVQDFLEKPLVLENVSTYAWPDKQMTELEFTIKVLEKADCLMLLDVNNVYVNSINHSYDPIEFIKALPTERIVYGHIAGHYDEANDLKIDTHGADVIQPVWDLLETAYEYHGVFPTLLERDFNIPPLNELLQELEKIRSLQKKYSNQSLPKVKSV